MKQKQWEQLREGLAGSVGEVLLYLTACALHDIVPDASIYTDVDETLLYLGAKSHTIVSMVAYALEKNGYQGISKQTADKFRTGRDKAVRKNMLLNAEREAVLSHLEQAKVRYLPLKGVVLQKIYPDFGMRQMADNDILYDVKYQMKLKDFMEGRGFRAENVGSGVHDCYYKEPVYNYEMHTQLFADTHKDGVAAEYYRDIWSRAVRDTDKKYGYHFTDEDFYVYVTAHAEKHHEGAGTGIRTLADVYVMLRSFEKADWKYIQEQLDKLGIAEFEKKVRFLARKLLSDPQKTIAEVHALRERELSELRYILTSGTYGTQENGVINRMRKLEGKGGKVTVGMKLRYYMSRTFPSRDFLYPYYPLARFRIFVPLVWVFRAVRVVLLRGKSVLNEIRIVEGQKEI